jgi:hypothetical protein
MKAKKLIEIICEFHPREKDKMLACIESMLYQGADSAAEFCEVYYDYRDKRKSND